MLSKLTFQAPQGTVLDITGSLKTGQELYQFILDEVKKTQAGVLRPLPDRILMTKQQFQDQETNTEEMENTKDRLYYTPLNVMEVEVVDA